MQIVKVKPKFQITLPSAVREQAKITVGDILEIQVDSRGALVLTVKSIIDRKVA